MFNLLQKRSGCTCVVVACFIATTFTTGIQAQRPVEPQQSSTVVVNTGEVALDVVVRDKRGRPAKDLSVSDFEVYEDGVKQEVNSFRFISSTATESDSSSQQTDRKDQQKPG